MNIINTNIRTFIIQLSWRISNSQFIFQNGLELKHILETYDKENKGIDFIKTFDSKKQKFVRISTKELLNIFSWETDFMEFSKTHYFFK